VSSIVIGRFLFRRRWNRAFRKAGTENSDDGKSLNRKNITFNMARTG